MKICAIICEYNPFHNGHLYQLQEAKKRSGADAVLCLMSGNFVQRGEAAIIDKYTRARHAVLSGADAVIELPTPFATSNAEIFAKGAVKILAAVPSVKTLCFGAETADKNAFLKAAEILRHEPKSVSEKIKALLATGRSFAKARAEAYRGILPQNLLSAPNTILGIEYTKALLDEQSDIEILPVQRIGSGYNDELLEENFSSASAIRLAIAENKDAAENLPSYVKEDLPKALENKLDCLEKYALLASSKEEIRKICDCTEGLENALQKAAELSPSLTQTLTSARYTSSRIRRIALQNLLKIEEGLIRDSLSSPLYLRLLAAKKERTDLLSALSESEYPLLSRAHDENSLCENAKKCLDRDIFAEKIYALLYSQKKKNIFI